MRIIEQSERAPPVVVATVVGQPVDVAVAAVPEPAHEGTPLFKVVEVFKAELGVSGTVHEVVHASCAELGIQTDDKSLIELANEVLVALGRGRI